MKFLFTIVFFFSISNVFAVTVEEYKAYLSARSDQEIYDLASAQNSGLGSCRVSNASACPSCYCDRYVKSGVLGTYDLDGWPKNPSTGDSTGCVYWPGGPKNVTTCWGGYNQAQMCTNDMVKNVASQLRDAIANDACKLSVYVQTIVPATKMVKFNDFDKVKFLSLEDSGGKNIRCGAMNLNESLIPDPDKVFFTELPGDFCRGVYVRAIKIQATTGTRPELTFLSLINFQQLINSSLNSGLNSASVQQYLADIQIFGLEGDAEVQRLMNLNLSDPNIPDTDLAKFKQFSILTKGQLIVPSSVSATTLQKLTNISPETSFQPTAVKPLSTFTTISSTK